jgi:hypothetical protein
VVLWSIETGAPVVRFDAVIDPTEQNEFYQRGSFNDLHFAPGGIIYAANSDQCVCKFLVQPDGLRTYVYSNGRTVHLVRPAVSP